MLVSTIGQHAVWTTLCTMMLDVSTCMRRGSMEGQASAENIGAKRANDQEDSDVPAKKPRTASEQEEDHDAAGLESAKQTKVSSAAACSSSG